MTSTGDDSGLINVATIAEIADDVKSPSAVSNWRTRHDDFPAPRSGTGRRVLFDLDEIETWLRENDKLAGRVPPLVRLRAILDGLRGDLPIEDALDFLRAALLYLVASRRASDESSTYRVDPVVGPEDRWQAVRRDPRPLRALARAAKQIEVENPVLDGLLEPLKEAPVDGVGDDQQLGLVQTLEKALDWDGESWDRAYENSWEVKAVELFSDLIEMETSGSPRFSAETTTPPSLAELFGALAPQHTETIFDPAAGTGGLLSEMAERTDPIQLYAADSDHDAAVFTRSRFFVEDLPLDFFEGSSLTRSSKDWPKVDLVVADPPFGLKKWGSARDYSSDRWQFGDVSPRSADFAWIQIGALSARPGGSALILSPAAALSEAGEAGRARKAMIERGVVEALVQLPNGVHSLAPVQPILWILRSAESPDPGCPILLIDASGLGKASRSRIEIPNQSRERIAELVKRWRDGNGISEEDREIAVEVPIQDIQEWDLSPLRYLAPPEVDPRELTARKDELEARLRDLLDFDFPPGSLDLDLAAGSAPTRKIGQVAELIGATGDPEDQNIFHEPDPGRVRFFSRRSLARRRPEFIREDDVPPNAVRAREGDLLILSAGPRIRIESIDARNEGSLFGRGVWLLRARDRNELAPEWLRLFLRSDAFENQAKRAGDWATGRVVSGPRIRRGSFEQYEIPVPPLDDQLEAIERFRWVADVLSRSRHISRVATDLEGVMSDLAMHGGRGVGDG